MREIKLFLFIDDMIIRGEIGEYTKKSTRTKCVQQCYRKRAIQNNQLYFCTLAMNNLKIKLRKQFHEQQHKKNEIIKNKFTN